MKVQYYSPAKNTVLRPPGDYYIQVSQQLGFFPERDFRIRGQAADVNQSTFSTPK